jgi:SAM (Sterile alpha motif) domain-containing protein
MSSRKVTNWLQSHRLGAYVDVFAEHEVTWDDLGELGEGDLRKMVSRRGRDGAFCGPLPLNSSRGAVRRLACVKIAFAGFRTFSPSWADGLHERGS